MKVIALIGYTINVIVVMLTSTNVLNNANTGLNVFLLVVNAVFAVLVGTRLCKKEET
jgi:hypothetical protein